MAHFPIEGAASMPPTIGNDDDVTKIPSPSNDTNKSTDTEGVERQPQLENSSGAVFSPPEIDVLVGGKRKGKKVRNKRVKKKNKSKNDNVKMEMLVGQRTTIVMVVHGPIILHGGRAFVVS